MDDAADEIFEEASSGASLSYPQQCSALKKNGHVLLKNRPCKIVEMSTSKTGKHGHAKVHMVGIDLFSGKKYDDICPSSHNMNVPRVTRKDYLVVNIDDGFLSLMDEKMGDTRDDLKVPEGDLGRDVKEKFEKGDSISVTVLGAMGEEQVISHKISVDK